MTTLTLGGVTPSRPCKFPVTWIYWWGDGGGSDTFTKCGSGTTMGNLSKPACFTKVYENNTVDSNIGTDVSWGYCPESCKGESPSPSSPYNLAKSKYNHLWKSDLYDLSVYNPPAPQARGGLKENIQFFSYRLPKPSKPIFFPKVEKSDAN